MPEQLRTRSRVGAWLRFTALAVYRVFDAASSGSAERGGGGRHGLYVRLMAIDDDLSGTRSTRSMAWHTSGTRPVAMVA